MRVMVTGGPDFSDSAFVTAVLDRIHSRRPISMLIHGAGPGTAALAERWANRNGVPVTAYPPDPDKHGIAAEPIRNANMLIHPPDLVVVFPGGRETAICKAQAEGAGRAVVVPRYRPPAERGEFVVGAPFAREPGRFRR